MRKIPTLFKRDPEDMSRVLDEVHPEAAWVLDGEGVPRRKYDGTCVGYLNLTGTPTWWARREIKPGKKVPAGFVEADSDPVTGKVVGWMPAERDGRWAQIEEALADLGESPAEGTYELVGPKVNGNPERYGQHTLVLHANADRLDEVPLDFLDLRGYVLGLAEAGVEGIVWHHPDGRMAKIKGRDFSKEA